MASRKRSLHCSVLLVMLLCLAGKAVAAVPVETSHYNSNTYTNLNTITSTGTITFSVSYDSVGEIKWYKDNVLVQSDVACTSATITTAWMAADYGMVRQLRVNAANADGTSNATIWNVEVQQTGTATIAKSVFPQPTIDYVDTLYVTGGWTNLPSLYLAGRQEDNAWIEYVEAKTYLIKAPVRVNGAALYITTDTVKEVRMQGISPSPSYCTQIRVENNGKLKIDKVKFYGWNIVNDAEITVNDVSPIIYDNANNQLDITHSDFRHIRVLFDVDQSSGDLINNNSFYEGNPTNMLVYMPGEGGSQGQIISNNSFLYGQSENFSSNRNYDDSGMVLQNNRFIHPCTSENAPLGKNIRLIGNEIVYSNWNLVEYTKKTFSKFNNLHDNGGNHNGFNGVDENYSMNDYCHDFTGFSCWYSQSGPGFVPCNAYIINGYAKDSVTPEGRGMGISLNSLLNGYVYNFTADNANNGAQWNVDHVVFRKCNFLRSVGAAFGFQDYKPEDNGYARNIYMIDSRFSDQNNHDYGMESDPAYNNDPTIWSINSFRRNSDNSLRRPVIYFYGTNSNGISSTNGQICSCVYLDACVRDSGGNPVSNAVITITPLTDTNYPAIMVNLPPPPSDLNEIPAQDLPVPDTTTFSSVLTDFSGHTPLPNYGWSADVEATPALLFCKERGSGTTGNYAYRITATYNSQSVSKDVTPDTSWFREDPCQPAKTVVLTFDKPAGKYALNVNGGTGSGIYDPGASVNITAGTPPSGKVFDKWIGDTTTVNDVNSASTIIVVPSFDVSVTAYFKDITYHLTVNGGEGSGDYPAGKIVVADAASTNGAQVFYKWTGDAEHVVSPTVYSSTLIMPAHDATVAATYRNSTSYSCRLTVADGEGTDFYAPGDNVTITAATAPGGKVFDHWEGDTASLVDAGSAATTLTGMPDDYLIVYPVYRASGLSCSDANLSNLTVSGGALLPRFSSYASGYAGIVGNGVTGVTVTPTASQGTRATITVNGTPVNSGSASGSIALNATGSTLITIVVAAPDAITTKTYTVSVTRTALATGYTLAAPSPASGEVNATSGNFTVTPNGKYIGTITVTPSGGGLSTPINLAFSNSSEPRTFSITPTAAGTVTLTPANNGGLTDPAAVAYTSYVSGTLRNSSWNYPNPVDFTKTNKTTITYTVAEECNVYICLYSLAGDLVKVLVDNKTTAPGKYYMDWYGDNDGGGKAASGVYLYVAKIGKDVIRKKIVLVR